MENKITREYFEIEGSNRRMINLDIHYIDSIGNKPIAIFAHGYKGFKDYGAWSLIGDIFAKSGIVFVRFNFSHNGVTPETPTDFSDLEAFGQNNFSKEMYDFNKVIDFIYDLATINNQWDENNISIIGHSRGGGMAIMTAVQNNKVKKLITWAAIADIGGHMPKGNELEAWRTAGVAFIANARTGQEMPHYFQFYEDYLANKDKFNIQKRLGKLDIPFLILHGDQDETVPLEAARQLKNNSKNGTLKIVRDADHSFGTKHPWTDRKLPSAMDDVVQQSIRFILQ